MLMRFFSDLHLEFGEWVPPALDTDKETVLVLAGDIAIASKSSTYQKFIETVTQQFRHVIYIMGNHEHYHGSVQRSIAKIKRTVGEISNLSIVENEVVTIDNVSFACCTLWTDFMGGNPLAMVQAQSRMNDYRQIRTEQNGDPYGRKLTPSDTLAWHNSSIVFLVDAIEEAKRFGRKVVVVTHHAPSHESIPERFRGDPLNYAYVSSLESMIEHMKPDMWIHGHLHDTQDYHIGKTNVLANPRGYHGHEVNPEFDPVWTIEL